MLDWFTSSSYYCWALLTWNMYLLITYYIYLTFSEGKWKQNAPLSPTFKCFAIKDNCFIKAKNFCLMTALLWAELSSFTYPQNNCFLFNARDHCYEPALSEISIRETNWEKIQRILHSIMAEVLVCTRVIHRTLRDYYSVYFFELSLMMLKVSCVFVSLSCRSIQPTA